MKRSSTHQALALSFLGQAVLSCIASALFTLTVAVVYGVLTSFGERLTPGVTTFLPSVYAWEAAGLFGICLALFNTTGDCVELDCDQGRQRHSAVAYGLAFATTGLFALGLQRVSQGNWLASYLQSWRQAAVVGAFLVTMLVAMRLHRRTLLSRTTP